jgi:hypothetical protein
VRALHSREQLAGNLLSGETPEGLLRDVALARNAMPGLNIDGAHFFTFGSLTKISERLNAMYPSGSLTRAPQPVRR